MDVCDHFNLHTTNVWTEKNKQHLSWTLAEGDMSKKRRYEKKKKTT